MRVVLLSGLAILCQALHAQNDYVREYVYLGPAPGVTTAPVISNIGILPPPGPPITAVPATNNWYTTGFGIERLLGKSGESVFSPAIGVGIDLGAIIPGQGQIFNNTLGSFSPNLYLHWEFNDRWNVFGTAGYSLLFNDFTANYYNFGGGLSYWLGTSQNRGLMFEFRRLNPIDSTVHAISSYNEIRLGVTFRHK
jgi:hypothetical protein